MLATDAHLLKSVHHIEDVVHWELLQSYNQQVVGALCILHSFLTSPDHSPKLSSSVKLSTVLRHSG